MLAISQKELIYSGSFPEKTVEERSEFQNERVKKVTIGKYRLLLADLVELRGDLPPVVDLVELERLEVGAHVLEGPLGHLAVGARRRREDHDGVGGDEILELALGRSRRRRGGRRVTHISSASGRRGFEVKMV